MTRLRTCDRCCGTGEYPIPGFASDHQGTVCTWCNGSGLRHHITPPTADDLRERFFDYYVGDERA